MRHLVGQRRSGALGEQQPRSCASKPISASVGTPSAVKVRTSPSRAVKISATGSACRRRAANSSASAEAVSSQCASSTTHNTGVVSAASLSMLSVARATRNGSSVGPVLLAERDPQRSGLRSRQPLEQRQHRPQQLVQPGERQRRLGLQPLRGQHPHARRAPHVRPGAGLTCRRRARPG